MSGCAARKGTARTLAVALAAFALLCALPFAAAGADARNVATGQEFDDVAEALAAAADGQTVQLSRNATVPGTIATAGDVTLDLNGHTLVVAAGDAAGSKADRTGGAWRHAGGVLTVADSAGRGLLDITLGSQHEASRTASYGYSGIAVAGGGKLIVDNAAVSVRYTGASTTSTVFTVRGVTAQDGDVTLAGEAALSVQGAPRQGAYGAQETVGVYAVEGNRGTVAVEEGARIEVRNVAAPIQRGLTPTKGNTATGANADGKADLIEVPLAPGDEIYDQAQQRFLHKAGFDSANDMTGYVFGAQMYYAPAMTLPDGVQVWAFSDPVSAEDAGVLERIKADHIFVRSDYYEPVCAYGIASAAGFEGAVESAGRVSVAAGQGRAVGALVGGGAWDFADARVDAACAGGTYKAKAGELDLADIAAFDARPDERIVYPGGAGYSLVREVAPVAVARAALGEGIDLVVDGALARQTAEAQYGSVVAESEDDEEDPSAVFVYLRPTTAGGYLYSADQPVGITGARDAFPEASKRQAPGQQIAMDGSVYTFLGWSARSSDKQPLYTDGIPVEGSSGSFRSNVYLFAIYDVQEKAVDVRFHVDGELYATAAGARASQTVNAVFAASDNPADPVAADAGKSFRGWGTAPDAKTIVYGNIKTVGELAGDGDAVDLYAVWKDASQPGPVANTATVRFLDSDRTTLVMQLDVEVGSTVAASTGEDPKPTGANRDLFRGWVDEGGTAFDPASTPVTRNMAVYATYLQTSSGGGSLAGSSGNAGKTALQAAGGAALASAQASGAAAKPATGAAAAATAATAAAGSAAATAEGAGADDAAAADGLAEAAFATTADDAYATEVPEEEAAAGEGAGEGGIAYEDANAAGFVATSSASGAALVAMCVWFLRRHAGEEDDDAEDAPSQPDSREPESICF